MEITINIFRVECNHGTKLFETALSAYWYFEKMKKKFDVSMWLVTHQHIKGRLLVTQELVAISPKSR